MTTVTMSAVFEDFNDPREEPAPPPVEDPPPPAIDLASQHTEAWTEGYMSGRQERQIPENLTAALLTSVHDLGVRTGEAVETAALAVADLLLNAVIATTANEQSDRMLARVRAVADRIKPALTVAPEFLLRDISGSEHRFGDIAGLAHALESGGDGEAVTIRWHRGNRHEHAQSRRGTGPA